MHAKHINQTQKATKMIKTQSHEDNACMGCNHRFGDECLKLGKYCVDHPKCETRKNLIQSYKIQKEKKGD